jgi:sortase A
MGEDASSPCNELVIRMRIYRWGIGILLMVGILVMMYPTISEWWNAKRQSNAVLDYDKSVQELKEKECEEMLAAAQLYNQQLAAEGKTDLRYEEVLDIDGNGMMGYILIEKIKVQLPIYHGTSEAVLQKGCGHMEGTSLPVGGRSAHCVLSSHRGLPGVRLFTDLDQLEIGDRFQIQVLHEVLTYEIDQIRIVEPKDTKDLKIVKGQDYCTLVTCTPYGVNTHRMLVRGKRIQNPSDQNVKIRKSESGRRYT